MDSKSSHTKDVKKWDEGLNFESDSLLKKFKIKSDDNGCCILINYLSDRIVRGVVLGELRRGEEFELNRAREFAIRENTRGILEKHKTVHEKERVRNLEGTLARQQALGLLGRIYVGSINFDVTEDDIKESFCVFGPIKYINMSIDPSTKNHKGFAFLEYETPEAAQLAIDYMNNTILGGRSIKVGRPSPLSQAQDVINEMAIESDRLNRIYVSSISPSVNSDDLTKIFNVFGKIRQCQFIRSIRKDKLACAYLEFESPIASKTAIASMNNFDLVGYILKVVKAVTPNSNELGVHTSLSNMPADVAATIAEISATVAANYAQETKFDLPHANIITKKNNKFVKEKPIIEGPTIFDPLKVPGFLSPPKPANDKITPKENKCPSPLPDKKSEKRDSHVLESFESDEEINITAKRRKMMMEKLNYTIPNRVMVLRNMVNEDEVDEYLESEVSEECKRYGKVIKVTIYLEKEYKREVKIFVEFSNAEDAEKTVNIMDKRQFNGRIISAKLYNQESYDLGDFTL